MSGQYGIGNMALATSSNMPLARSSNMPSTNSQQSNQNMCNQPSPTITGSRRQIVIQHQQQATPQKVAQPKTSTKTTPPSTSTNTADLLLQTAGELINKSPNKSSKMIIKDMAVKIAEKMAEAERDVSLSIVDKLLEHTKPSK